MPINLPPTPAASPSTRYEELITKRVLKDLEKPKKIESLKEGIHKASSRSAEEVQKETMSLLDEVYHETKVNQMEERVKRGKELRSKGIEPTRGLYGDLLKTNPIDDSRSIDLRYDDFASGSVIIDANKGGKSIASARFDAGENGGSLKFVKSSLTGAKEGALDRVLLEAIENGYVPRDSIHTFSGTKAVVKRLQEIKANPNFIKEGIEKIRSTGKLGKIWSKAPIIGPGIAALTALLSDGDARAEALIDMADPTGGLLSPTTMGDGERKHSGRKPDSSIDEEAIRKEVEQEDLNRQYDGAFNALSAFHNRQAVQLAGSLGDLTGGVAGRDVFSSRGGKAANTTSEGRAAISKDLFNSQLRTLTEDLGMTPEQVIDLMKETQENDIMELQRLRESDDPWGGLIKMQEAMRQPRTQDFAKKTGRQA